MEKTIFTPEFYRKVYDSITDDIDDMDDGSNYFECVIGDVTVSMSVLVDVTEEDRSFSHAFGIEHETGYVRTFADIADVEVWDGDGDPVEGFSVEAFNEQLMNHEVRLSGKTVRRGDTVTASCGYRTMAVEFVGYDTARDRYEVLHGGKRCHVSRIRPL